MVNLCIELQGFAPVLQPVKLRPGPPISLHMSPGHPFREQVYTPFLTCLFLNVNQVFCSFWISTPHGAGDVEIQVLYDVDRHNATICQTAAWRAQAVHDGLP